jgi:hypothetical protein
LRTQGSTSINKHHVPKNNNRSAVTAQSHLVAVPRHWNLEHLEHLPHLYAFRDLQKHRENAAKQPLEQLEHLEQIHRNLVTAQSQRNHI